MPRIPGLRRLFRLAASRTRADADEIDDELSFHVESRVDELVALNVSREDARALALRELGDWNRYRGDCLTIDHEFARERRMRDFVGSLSADLRYGARTLRAEPAFSVVAVVTLALGIGATTSVFSVVSGVVLRPLPYANAERIVHVGERNLSRPGPGGTTSYENFEDWRRLSRSFQAIGIVSNFSPTMTGRGDPERVGVALVSAGVFDVFHLRPILGRPIVAADNYPSSAPVAILSFDFWRTKFGADSNVLGKTVMLNFTPVTIVGVLPPSFVGTGRLARPMWGNIANSNDGRGGRSKDVYALLRPGVTAVQAQSEMTQIAARLAALYPNDNKGETVIVDPLADLVIGDVRRPLFMLLGASFVVLLIACANLSNLLLARGISRGRELAVRAALGASRPRIARQLLTESLLLATLGSLGGILIATSVIKLLTTLGPAVFQTRPPAMSASVLIIAIALSAITTLVFGLVPALRLAPRNPQLALRDGGTRVTGGHGGRTRATLAVTQLSLAVVLLSISALVIKSFARVLQVEPGIRGDHLLTMSVTLPQARYDSLKSTIFYRQLAERLVRTPGVAGVAVTSLVPFGGDFDRVHVSKIAGEPDRVGADAATGDRYVVSPSYFATMGVRLLRGRLPEATDLADAPSICVVDDVFARRTFGSREAIGQRMQIPGRPDYATIVGVVTHVKTYGLDAESPGQIYLSNEQYPWRWSSVVVRTTSQPLLLAQTVARAVHDIDADQPVADVASMDDLMADLLRARRFTLTVLSAFAVVAITLASIGLYGVVAYGVTQRRREFGVRLALGARRGQIARLVVFEGGRIAAIGALIGAAGALGAGRFISSLLFEVSPHDAVALVTVALGLVAVALLACLLPAHRATTVDAAEVLRGP